jgi:hypothetical protein
MRHVLAAAGALLTHDRVLLLLLLLLVPLVPVSTLMTSNSPPCVHQNLWDIQSALASQTALPPAAFVTAVSAPSAHQDLSNSRWACDCAMKVQTSCVLHAGTLINVAAAL